MTVYALVDCFVGGMAYEEETKAIAFTIEDAVIWCKQEAEKAIEYLHSKGYEKVELREIRDGYKAHPYREYIFREIQIFDGSSPVSH